LLAIASNQIGAIAFFVSENRKTERTKKKYKKILDFYLVLLYYVNCKEKRKRNIEEESKLPEESKGEKRER